MRDGRPEYEGCALTFRALERDRRLAILKDRKLFMSLAFMLRRRTLSADSDAVARVGAVPALERTNGKF